MRGEKVTGMLIEEIRGDGDVTQGGEIRHE